MSEEKVERVSVRMSKDRADQIAAYAEAKGISVPDAVDKFIDTAIVRMNALLKYAKKQKKLAKEAAKDKPPKAKKPKKEPKPKAAKKPAAAKKPRKKKGETAPAASETPAEPATSNEAATA